MTKAALGKLAFTAKFILPAISKLTVFTAFRLTRASWSSTALIFAELVPSLTATIVPCFARPSGLVR